MKRNIPLSLATLAVASTLAACSSDAANDQRANTAVDPSGNDDGTMDPQSQLPNGSDEPPTSVSVGIAPDCDRTTSNVALDAPTALGQSANDVIATIADSAAGTMSYADGSTSAFQLVVAADGSTAEVLEVAASDACTAYANMTLRVTATFSTADGAFDETFGGMVSVMANADGDVESLELVGDAIAASTMTGSYVPNGVAKGEAQSMDIFLNAFFDGLRPMRVDDESSAPDMVSGYLFASGSSAADDCVGSDCLVEAVREPVGSFLFD